MLLDHGIDVPIERDEFQLRCPFHEDSRASCSINLEKGVWICFAGCGQGSLEYLLQKLLGKSREEIDSLLLNYEVDYSLSFLDAYLETAEEEEEEMLEVSIEYDKTRVPPWIFDRGFNRETLIEWECGADIEGSLVIPVKDGEGRLVGTITRRLNREPKYLYSQGLRKSRLLFGGHKIESCKFVYITEGSLDAMWLHQNNLPAVSLLGATMSKVQEELLMQLPVEELVLCLDNDKAGEIGMQKALTSLSARCRVSRVNLPGGYKDVQDIKDVTVLNETVEKRIYW